MSLPAGDLRHRIVIQERIDVQDSNTGGVTPTWVEARTLWAALKPLNARERLAAAAVRAELTVRFVFRVQPGFTFLPSMRILHRGRVYDPAEAVPDPESGLEFVSVPCSEGMTDG